MGTPSLLELCSFGEWSGRLLRDQVTQRVISGQQEQEWEDLEAFPSS